MNYLKKQNDVDVLETIDNRSSYMCKWCRCNTKITYYKGPKRTIRYIDYNIRWCFYCPKCLR